MRACGSLRLPALLACVVSASACLDDSVTGTRALAFSISAEPTTAAVDEEVTFSFTGEGTNITAVIVSFGDGTADTLTYGAAVMVTDFTVHSYAAPGIYTAQGTIVAGNGTLSDEAAVTVN